MPAAVWQLEFAASDKKVSGCCIEMSLAEGDNAPVFAAFWLFAEKSDRDGCACAAAAGDALSLSASRVAHSTGGTASLRLCRPSALKPNPHVLPRRARAQLDAAAVFGQEGCYDRGHVR